MINALPYLILIIFYGGLAIIHHQLKGDEKQTYVNVISIGVYIIFFGFRGFIFYDWTSYYPEFSSLPDFGTLFTLNLLKWSWEPGFTILGVLCKSLFDDYQFFIFICCLINTYLLVKFFKRYVNNLPLALMIFLAMRGITLSTDLMRNSISLFIILNALQYIIEKKPLPYFLLCGVAVMFHSSALTFFPLYFLLNRKYNRWILLSIFIAANIIYIAHIPILESILSLFIGRLADSTQLWIKAYLEMDSSAVSFISIGYLERLLTGILLFCYFNKLCEMRKHNYIFVNSLFLCLCTFLFLSEFRTISVRCSTLFCFAYWIVWIDLIKCFYYRNNKILFIAFIGIYCIMRTYGDCNSALASYYNVLFQNQTYNERLLNFRQHFNDKD